jgi:hypothetical protein
MRTIVGYVVLALLLTAKVKCQEKPPAEKLGVVFWIVNGANFGAAALDVESTQRCIRELKCHEGNPIMPSGRGGQYAEMMGIAAASTFVSAKLKRNGEKWIVLPVIGITGHGFAASWNFHF